jgi:regulatory protein
MTMDERNNTDTAPDKRPRGARKSRRPRKVTRQSLENAALAYLGRFAATAHSLEAVLMRRVFRSARFHNADPAEGAELVSAIIARYREAGLVNDAAFAEARAKTLFARGTALRTIALKLRQKGVGDREIEAALARLADGAEGAGDADSLNRQAAQAYARRRRLGPWRTGPAREGARERDMAALARAGFSYAIAREIIGGEDTR